MKVGDLVRYRCESIELRMDVGIILEIRYNEEQHPDYRVDDAVLVLWAGGHEWSWRSELEGTYESR